MLATLLYGLDVADEGKKEIEVLPRTAGHASFLEMGQT